MAGLSFRTLKASEIECRISTVNENGISLLLYKDARVDQNLLDETVGPMNWQRFHSRDNANCTVSIWDEDKQQWISKEDTGTESNTEKEKGLASDSFKRACFNWGIGRELYSAPFIWINKGDCTIKDSGRKNQGKPVYTCYDRFYVSSIGYDDNRNINQLTIKKRGGGMVFTYNDTATVADTVKPIESKNLKQEAKPKEQAQGFSKLSDNYVNAIYNELRRTGIGLKSFLQRYGKENVNELSFDEWKDGMNRLKSKPDFRMPNMEDGEYPEINSIN